MNNTLYNNTSKDKLAKLLAMEDIHVRHSAEASTASFDVKHRVLTLPVWANLSAAVVDMMTGHEVGHALWTPLDGWKEALDEMIHKGILNIVEDARIEKKIKRKYPGIVKPFLDGYKELYNKQFFGSTPFDELTFIDRINLFYKLGSLSGIFFTKEEEPYVKLVGDCETWDDVVECAKILQIKYTEDVVTVDLKELNVIPSNGTGSAFDNPDGFDEDRELEEDPTGRDFKELQNDEESEEESEKSETSSGGNGNEDENETMPSAEDFDGSEGGRNELDSDFEDFETESTWENRKEELAEDKHRGNYQYFGLPTPVLSKIVVNHKEIIKVFDQEMKTTWDRTSGDLDQDMRREMTKVTIDSNFVKFRSDSVKIVNYMAKEFERKKAANELRRVTVSKTGILDMNKIHQYKFNDDIFLKKSFIPDGKNHGMIVLVDWSASMTPILLDTIKQTLNLVWFCQKVNIPFEVYAFSNAYMEEHPDEDSPNYREELERWYSRKGKWNAKMGEVNDFNDNMNLLNFLSSRMSGRDLNKMAKYLYRYACSLGGYHRTDESQNYGYYMHERWRRLGMGSTPTVEAMMAMQAIVPKFKRGNNLDKVNLICLTDGEPNSQFSHCEDPTAVAASKHLSFRLSDHVIFDDPMSRRKYDLIEIMNRDKGTGCYRNTYEMQVIFMCDLLRDRFGVNCIGMFLNGQNSVRAKELEKYYGWRRFNQAAHQKARQGLRKDGFVTITNSGWDEYYILPTGKLRIRNDGDYTVDPKATAGKIKTAFAKSLNQKFGSRVLVDRLMNWIT